MTSISKNVCIDKLNDIVNKYNNKYHKTVEMKSVDVNPSTYIEFNKKHNKIGRKFRVDGNARISKDKNIFAKD